MIYKALIGVDGVTLPDDPIQAQPTLAPRAAAFEAQPPVRILFDNGAGARSRAQPYRRASSSPSRASRSRARSARVVVPRRRRHADRRRAAAAGADTFTWNKAARPATDFTGDTGAGGLWTATPAYDWTPNPAGTALSYRPRRSPAEHRRRRQRRAVRRGSSPRRATSTCRSTVTEVRPDGKETFVQSGWLRTSLRRLDARAEHRARSRS